MTFADWQFSHGIVPWVIVHDFSEYRYRRLLLLARASRVSSQLFGELASAFRDFGAALTEVAAALNALGQAGQE